MSSQRVRSFFKGSIEFRENSPEESEDVGNVENFKLNIVIHGRIESVLPPTEAKPNEEDESDEEDGSSHSSESSKVNLEAQIPTAEEQISRDSSQSGVHVDGKGIPVEEIHLVSGAAMLPHPDKASTGGEDAYFISDNKWFGIADGVSQWSEIGINAGIYARELMENCKEIVSDAKGSEVMSPRKVLELSAEKSKSPRSSTVLVAYFDAQDQVLHVGNIGDSGFLILRNGNVYKKSAPMTFDFNCPHQIKSGDDPSEFIKRFKVELVEGDVIILATDGLYDNLYEKEIATTVSSSLAAGIGVKEIAELLARRAHEVGASATERTPFADAAEGVGYSSPGGKLDDVTVIVSVVKKESNLDHASV